MVSALALVACQSANSREQPDAVTTSSTAAPEASILETTDPHHSVGQPTHDSSGISSDVPPTDAPSLPPGVPDTYYADLAKLAAGIGLVNPPPVAPIRAVSRQEIDQVMADCMTNEGFPTEVQESGGWAYDVPQGQREAANLASYVCQARYPLAAKFVAPLTIGQLRIYYDWQVEETMPCMDSLDYPTPEPPTFETYVANHEVNQAVFFADGALDSATIGEAMSDIMDKCQVVPPDDLLYGT